MFDELAGERDNMRRQHEEIAKKLWVEARTSEERVGTEQDGVLLRYHGVLQSTRGIFKAADEHRAGHTDTLSQLRLLFEEGRKLKVVVSTTGPSLKGLSVAKLESPLESMELELQTLPELASESLKLGAEVSGLRAFVETFGCWRQEIVMLTQDVCDLTPRFTNIRAEAKNLRKQDAELKCGVRERDVRAFVESAR